MFSNISSLYLFKRERYDTIRLLKIEKRLYSESFSILSFSSQLLWR